MTYENFRRPELRRFGGLDSMVIKKPDPSSVAMILFHGYGANMYDLIGLSDQISACQNMDVVSLQAPLALPGFIEQKMSMRCWFHLDNRVLTMISEHKQPLDVISQFEGHRVPEDYRTSLMMVREALVDLSQRYDKLILLGFSQGGMVVTDLVVTWANEVL
ncbi:MAG: hypothetical protein OXC40_00920, partial [Proteobacteria bacterium]|nr:hypothetical protein [Pseudomonadota bacterium]